MFTPDEVSEILERSKRQELTCVCVAAPPSGHFPTAPRDGGGALFLTAAAEGHICAGVEEARGPTPEWADALELVCGPPGGGAQPFRQP